VSPPLVVGPRQLLSRGGSSAAPPGPKSAWADRVVRAALADFPPSDREFEVGKAILDEDQMVATEGQVGGDAAGVSSY
jgi:hypothetical protein